MSEQRPLVLAGVGADFPDLAAERTVLAPIGAEVLDARNLQVGEVLKLARTADAVLTDYFVWSDDAIAGLERCRVICQYGVGVDRIDVDAAARAGIAVTNTPDYCVDEMADHALALFLAVTRKVALYDRAVRSGRWDYNLGSEMRRIRTLTLGLVGAGRIGSAFALRGRALGMRILAADPNRSHAELRGEAIEPVELEDLLRVADVVSLHIPLTPSTSKLLGRERIAAMKPGAIVINTARGGLIDQLALEEALRSGSLGGAGLDVLAVEPPRPNDSLLELDNVVITPHAGFLSRESLADVQAQAAHEAFRALSGEPMLHVVGAHS